MNEPSGGGGDRSQAKINLTPEHVFYSEKEWTDGRITVGVTFLTSTGDYTFYFPEGAFGRFALDTLDALTKSFRRMAGKETDSRDR